VQSSATDIEAVNEQRCQRIRKTVVYMEHIADLEIAEQFLVSRLVAIGIPVVVASKAVTCYHSELAEDDKRAISNEFKK